ncbi:MAG: hypothetical protein IJW55_04125 [Clostridia bacterium]|nr:hypothetical protein [Clostridia bacterium]
MFGTANRLSHAVRKLPKEALTSHNAKIENALKVLEGAWGSFFQEVPPQKIKVNAVIVDFFEKLLQFRKKCVIISAVATG